MEQFCNIYSRDKIKYPTYNAHEILYNIMHFASHISTHRVFVEHSNIPPSRLLENMYFPSNDWLSQLNCQPAAWYGTTLSVHTIFSIRDGEHFRQILERDGAAEENVAYRSPASACVCDCVWLCATQPFFPTKPTHHQQPPCATAYPNTHTASTDCHLRRRRLLRCRRLGESNAVCCTPPPVR